ncbi:MAG: SDR family oxidoreductase [Planctomycetota bacterium]
MPSVLITGSNRGLGLEFARQYAADGWRVFAACRDPERARELQALAGERVSLHALEVTDFVAVERLAGELSGEALDVVLNNAGVFGDAAPFGEVDYDVFRRTLEVNTLAPLRLAECFVGHLERGQQKKLVNITSRMGSIEDNTSGGRYAYRASKAALNMVNRCLAVDLAGRLTAVVLHPGWVATDMGGPSAPLRPEGSVRQMRAVIAGLSAKDSGGFFNYDGASLPW